MAIITQDYGSVNGGGRPFTKNQKYTNYTISAGTSTLTFDDFTNISLVEIWWCPWNEAVVYYFDDSNQLQKIGDFHSTVNSIEGNQINITMGNGWEGTYNIAIVGE